MSRKTPREYCEDAEHPLYKKIATHATRSQLEEQWNSQSEEETTSGSSEVEEEQGGDDIPLGELVSFRHDGSTDPASMRRRAMEAARASKSFKRESKHRPVEMSSKRPVPILRDAFQAGKHERKDPRFESLSAGSLDENKFRKRYKFLYDEHLPDERKELKAALNKTKSAMKKAELQAELTRVSQAIKDEERKRRVEALHLEQKAKEKEAVKAGKAPFYLKASEKKRLDLLAKYEDLKSSGRLDKYIEKKRKKNAAKDHRYLPVGRRQ